MKITNSGERRILFTPHEIGGQMQLMAETFRRRGMFATACTFHQERVKHVNDINLDLNIAKGRFRRLLSPLLFAAFAMSNYDIFHFFWGESMISSRFNAHHDLPVLKKLGKKILVHFRGLDIVDLKHFDYLRSKAQGVHMEPPPVMRDSQKRSLDQWIKYSDALLVSEPDLCAFVPNAILVPQAIDMTLWRVEARVPKFDDKIRIVHAPTMRRKKGTEFIEQAVEQLQKEGYPVELILAENLPFHKILENYAQADIGVDQVLYGWHGKVSLELMAMKLPVICYIDENLRSHYRPDLPIISASPADLVEKLRMLIEDPQMRERLGVEGRDYVLKYHDVERVVDQLTGIYNEI